MVHDAPWNKTSSLTQPSLITLAPLPCLRGFWILLLHELLRSNSGPSLRNFLPSRPLLLHLLDKQALDERVLGLALGASTNLAKAIRNKLHQLRPCRREAPPILALAQLLVEAIWQSLASHELRHRSPSTLVGFPPCIEVFDDVQSLLVGVLPWPLGHATIA